MIGLSGFHSKDYIIAQALSFWDANPRLGGLFFYAALVGAGMTAFYMFRLWYMTFAGNPRDGYVYHHAHESPGMMTVPLMILAFFAVVAAWNIPGTHIGLDPLLRQAQPAGIGRGHRRRLASGRHVTMPAEHLAARRCHRASRPSGRRSRVALAGFVLATAFYGLRKLDAEEPGGRSPALSFRAPQVVVRRIVRLAVCPAGAADFRLGGGHGSEGHRLAGRRFGPGGRGRIARIDDWIDRVFVDAWSNAIARWTYALGLRLRGLQTGNIRQYVMWIAVGTVGLFVVASMYWNYVASGM